MAFHNFQFILIDADEYAVNYMEKHSADFPQANIQFILPKLKRILEQKYEEIKADFQQHDPGNEGRIPGDIFRWVAKRVIWYYLTQMYTLPPLFPPLPPAPHSGAMPDPTCPGIRTLFPYPKSCHMRKIRIPLPPPRPAKNLCWELSIFNVLILLEVNPCWGGIWIWDDKEGWLNQNVDILGLFWGSWRNS